MTQKTWLVTHDTTKPIENAKCNQLISKGNYEMWNKKWGKWNENVCETETESESGKENPLPIAAFEMSLQLA